MATTTSPFFPYCRRIRHESVRTDRQLSDDVRRPPARATTTMMMMMTMISIAIRGFPDRAARYIVSDETISYIEAYVDDSSYCNHHTPPPARAGSVVWMEMGRCCYRPIQSVIVICGRKYLGGRDFLSMPWFLFASGMLQTVFAQNH